MLLPEIGTFWMGTRLSFLEQLCLKSFADLGHKITLYAYEPIVNVPEGVEMRDGREILDEDVYREFKNLGAPAIFSDKFRLHMLAKTNAIWVDCDAYAWAPFPDVEYIIARDTPGRLASGILRLPKNSEALRLYIDFVASSYPVLPNGWPNYPHTKSFAIPVANTLHITEMEMWSWGPVALTYFLLKTGEIKHEMKGELFYPLPGLGINRVFRSNERILGEIKQDECLSVHFFGSLLRRKVRARYPEGNLPENSFLVALCEKHGIDPKEYPVL